MLLNFAGLSLKSQELTALFLAVRLYCSFVMEYDVHTLLDLLTLATTLWVIYMIRFNLKSSYMDDKDNFAMYYVVSLPIFLDFDSCIFFPSLVAMTLNVLGSKKIRWIKVYVSMWPCFGPNVLVKQSCGSTHNCRNNYHSLRSYAMYFAKC